jgi:hypothetical protein
MSQRCASALAQTQRSSAAPKHHTGKAFSKVHVFIMCMKTCAGKSRSLGDKIAEQVVKKMRFCLLQGIPWLGCAQKEQTPCLPSLQCWKGSGRTTQHSATAKQSVYLHYVPPSGASRLQLHWQNWALQHQNGPTKRPGLLAIGLMLSVMLLSQLPLLLLHQNRLLFSKMPQVPNGL